MAFRLLDAFANEFRGKQYSHRNQTIGNFIASHLYDDLLHLNHSPKFVTGVRDGTLVVNTGNIITGRKGRRGDGTLGEIVPGESAQSETGLVVRRGPLASILVGAEVKILGKAMIKQIDRVMNDLLAQANTFRGQTARATTVAIVGVNCSAAYTSYEGDRAYPADPPPAREAPRAIERLFGRVPAAYDELLILEFRATNVPPYPFEWVNEKRTKQTYAAALLRISTLFEQRN